MPTASIDGFKRNWWSDKHEYRLESLLLFGTPQKTASCKVLHHHVMRQKVRGGAHKPGSLKSGEATFSPSLNSHS